VLPRVTWLILFCGLCLAASGCGGGVPVEGKVVKGGSPYTLAEGEGITITLVSEDGKTNCSGKVEKDGSFTLLGPSGGAVPPGKYKVGYVHYAPAPGPTKGAPPPVTKNTKETWDINSSNRTFTLDIGK